MPKCKNDSSRNYKGTEPSPKGLGYCAHAEKLNSKKKGKDEHNWYVIKTKVGVKRWAWEKTIFVFYNLSKSVNWSYPKLPKTWYWVGSGSTKKSREEQFNGNPEYAKQMIKLLKNKFTTLKNKGIISKFKID